MCLNHDQRSVQIVHGLDGARKPGNSDAHHDSDKTARRVRRLMLP